MADRKRMQFDSRLSDAEWIRLLGEMWDLPAVDLDDIEVIDEVLAIIPKELAKRRSVFPVSLVTEDDEEELILAVADPSDVAAREEAAFVSGRDVVVVVSTHEQIERAIDRSYDRNDRELSLDGVRTGAPRAVGAEPPMRASDELSLSSALSKKYNIPSIDLEHFDVDPEVVALCPRDFAERHHLILVARARGALIVAIADPSNLSAIDDLRSRLNLNLDVELVVASREAIARAIERFYGGSR